MEPIVHPRSRGESFGMSDIQRLGYWSAAIATLSTVLFGCAVFLGLLGVSSKTFAYLVCLPLALSFVVMIACIHYQAPRDKRIWSLVGLCFAVAYASLTTLVYYVQLSAARNYSAELLPFIFTPGSVFFAVDMLGYGFMCLATWFAAGVFGSQDSLSLWIRRLAVFHGWLVFPTLIAPALLPSPSLSAPEAHGVWGSLVLVFWCLVFAPLAYLVARHFRAMRLEPKR